MEPYKIKVIIPIRQSEAERFLSGFESEINQVIGSDFAVDYTALDSQATAFIQSRASELWDSRSIVELAIEAQKEGFSGVFVNCFGEPGVEVLKEILDIPVVGGFAPAMMNAMMVSSRLSIVTVVDSVVPMLWDLSRKMGLGNQLASVRKVDIPVTELTSDDLLVEQLVKESKIAIDQQGAEAIVLGCTGMLKVHQEVSSQLSDSYNRYVPVIAPVGAAIGILQNLIKNDLSASRLTYYKPTEFGVEP